MPNAVPLASGLLNQCYRLFFNNSEEVKVSVPGGAGGSHENEFPCAAEEPGIGLDCIVASGAQKEPDAGKHEFTCSNGLRA